MRIDYIPAHPSNHYQGRAGNSILYIVMHYTGNNGDTAAGNGNYFSGANIGTSAHYFVDAGNVVQSVKDADAAWHCGGPLESAHHPYRGICTNRNSIGVEMCSMIRDGKYTIPDATVDRALELVRYLMDRYNIPASRVIRHYDVTGKRCPEPWVRNESLWTSFKSRLEEEDMTEKQVREIARDEILKVLAEQRHSSVDDFTGRIHTELQALAATGTLKGKGGSEAHKGIDMTEDMARVLTLAKDYTDKVFDSD